MRWLNGPGCRRMLPHFSPKPEPWQNPFANPFQCLTEWQSELADARDVSTKGTWWDSSLSLSVFIDRSYRSGTLCPSPWPGLSQGMLRWLSESWLPPSVGPCSLQPCVSRGAAPAPAFLIISPCCWAWPHWVLQHLQQLRRTSYHYCTLVVLLTQAGLASMVMKQLWGFLGVMRIYPWLTVEVRT